MEWRSKKGSLVIFLALFFTALIGAMALFIDFTKEVAVQSASKSLGNLWVQSLLGEYDINLYSRYGLYGYRGNAKDLAAKVDAMARYSFNTKPYIDYGGATFSFMPYALNSPHIFRQEIVDAGKRTIVESLADNLRGPTIDYPESDDDSQGGFVANGKILKELPSNSMKTSIDIMSIGGKLKDLGDIKQVVNLVGDELMTAKYEDKYFKNMADSKGLGKTVFKYEQEYLIFGKASDQKNKARMKMAVLGVREILNAYSIYKDPTLHGVVTEAALALTPGPQALLTEKALLAAWALAESVNDYQLLIHGKKVPTLKNSDSWATDIDAVIQKKEGPYIDMDYDNGGTYNDYIHLFAIFIDRDIKLLRMMDIIQLNMMLLYNRDFLMKEHFTGIQMNLRVNDNIVSVGKTYYGSKYD